MIREKRVTIADRNTGQIRVSRDLILAGIEFRPGRSIQYKQPGVS